MAAVAVDPWVRFMRFVVVRDDGCWEWTGTTAGTSHKRPWRRTTVGARLSRCRSDRHDLTDPSNVRFDEKGRRRGCLPCRLERVAARRGGQ